MPDDWKASLRGDLERTGERAVRDDLNNRGGLSTGGEERLQVIRHWLREKDLEREARETAIHDLAKRTFSYTRWTYYAALAALIATLAGIVVTLLHL